MHLALPMRKSSDPPPYVRPSHFRRLRKSRIQAILLCACAVGAFFFMLLQVSGNSETIPGETSSVVLVTVLDREKYNRKFINIITENRIEYASKHNYATFFPNVTDYDIEDATSTWARVPAVRHALTKFPRSSYVWYLEQNALIMNQELTVERDIMDPKKLEDMMIRDQPIVPPDSVVKTFPKLKGTEIDLVLTQDKDGLAKGSFIIRRGDWSKFFLDTWFDPLYRSYNFQKAEIHALEHIVQWHPTILSKLALVPQSIMNAYSKEDMASKTGVYKEGDFVVQLNGCEQPVGRDCVAEAELFLKQSRPSFRPR